jgi:hypothetical protein
MKYLLGAALALGCVAGCVSPSDPVLDHWHYAYATIIAPRCTTSACHSKLSEAGHLDLSDDATAYRELTGRACDDTATAVAGYVDTTNPAASRLSELLRRQAPTGMPPAEKLVDDEISVIEDWMRGGALCD